MRNNFPHASPAHWRRLAEPALDMVEARCFGTAFDAMQTAPLADLPGSDMIAGLRFRAALHLHTPLRVLRRHGELHTRREARPVRIAQHAWEGRWAPYTYSFQAMGLEVEIQEPQTSAGPKQQTCELEDTCVDFLKTICEIAESRDAPARRIAAVRRIAAAPSWRKIAAMFGGPDAIVCDLFGTAVAAPRVSG